MALSHNPSIITQNLLLNLDFKNPKRFSTDLGTGNLVQNHNYNASTWGNYFPANATVMSGIDAPDGSKTAVRVTCNTTGSSLFRVSFSNFIPDGTSTYVCSFFVRKISGTTSSGSTLSSDVHDGMTVNYISQLVTNKWVRVVYTGIPIAVDTNFMDLLSNNTNNYVLDFWGIKLETVSSNAPLPFKDTVGNNIFNIYKSSYTALDENAITFNRTTAPAAKNGGLAFTTGTGPLTSANFLYNDHTWEVWFKINDITPEGTSTEGLSSLINYRGYHAGFQYTASTMYYYAWNNTTAIGSPCVWTLGTSGTQIVQGAWYQIVVVRNGNTFTPYLNGVQSAAPGTFATVINTAITNDIHIGGMVNGATGAGASNYAYYSRNTIANAKMYNRSLTAAEVAQNFNALRGRYGL